MFPENIILAARKAYTKYNILASVTLAQWAIESGYGKHSPGNNPFGMKATSKQDGKVLVSNEQTKSGIVYQEPSKFRTFTSIDDAFDAHGKLLATGKPYIGCYVYRDDYHMYCTMMGRIYATDLQYGRKLISIIDQYNLTQYDKKITSDAPVITVLTAGAATVAVTTVHNIQPSLHNFDYSMPLVFGIGLCVGMAFVALVWAITAHLKQGNKEMPSQQFNDALSGLVTAAKKVLSDKQAEVDAANNTIAGLQTQLTQDDADTTAAVVAATAEINPPAPAQ